MAGAELPKMHKQSLAKNSLVIKNSRKRKGGIRCWLHLIIIAVCYPPKNQEFFFDKHLTSQECKESVFPCILYEICSSFDLSNFTYFLLEEKGHHRVTLLGCYDKASHQAEVVSLCLPSCCAL